MPDRFALDYNGIHTPLITPFNADYSINTTVLAELIDHLIDAGVHGLILAGTTGEYYAQTIEERIRLMEFTQRLIAHRVPLTVGTGAIRTEDAIVLAKAARDAGADAILITTPPYATPTPREIAVHALAVERAAALPVMLYNYPARMGASMDVETLDRLGRSPRFCAIKESSGAPNRLHLLARDYPHIQLCCGMDDQALEYFAWGARCWVCAGSNFAPRAHIALYDACVLQGDFVRGRKIMSAMLPLLRVLEQGGKFVQAVKHGVTLRGFAAGPPRLPLQALNKDEQRELATVIRTLDRVIDAFGSEAS